MGEGIGLLSTLCGGSFVGFVGVVERIVGSPFGLLSTLVGEDFWVLLWRESWVRLLGCSRLLWRRLCCVERIMGSAFWATIDSCGRGIVAIDDCWKARIFHC